MSYKDLPSRAEAPVTPQSILFTKQTGLIRSAMACHRTVSVWTHNYIHLKGERGERGVGEGEGERGRGGEGGGREGGRERGWGRERERGGEREKVNTQRGGREGGERGRGGKGERGEGGEEEGERGRTHVKCSYTPPLVQ